jgi:hypothetical protein
MARDFSLVTAEQLDKMTPNERAELLRSQTITDLSELSPEFRQRTIAKAKRISDDLRSSRTAS